MPFQSEKQRRYLWANEPEIARDWTDTYGSGIAKALGGRIGFFKGAQADTRSGRAMSPGTSASGGTRDRSTRDRSGPINIHADTAPVIAQQRKTDFLNEARRQQAEKEYTRQGVKKVGPQLALAGSGIGGGGIKNFLGNWAGSVGGAQLGGGLGSLLLGPWGMLLGSIFGGGVGRRGWQASQTDEKETMKQILMPEFMQNLGLFDKRIKEPPRGEGVETIDIRDKFNRRGDDFSEIEGQVAGIKDMSVFQIKDFKALDLRDKMNKSGVGPPLSDEENQRLEKLRNLRNSRMISAEGNPIV